MSSLPAISSAKLPRTYESAKEALSRCSEIDECAEWANKAEALASYARQSNDDTLRKTCDRIQARAVQRCGELLQAIKGARGGNRGNAATGGRPPVGKTRTDAARNAGMSEQQRKTALRVANVPKDEFDAAVESENPPTVTALAERGKVAAPKPLVDLDGRDPKEFALSTTVQGRLRDLSELLARVAPSVAMRAAFPHERDAMARQAKTIAAWLERLLVEFDTHKEKR